MKFTVPLPPRELSSNGSHGHWSKVSEARARYRRECWMELFQHHVRDASWQQPERVRMSLTFGIKGGRAVGRYQPRDAANALSAFKAGIDGLVDAGMCPDDSAKHLELGAILIDSTRGPFVEVEVEAL